MYIYRIINSVNKFVYIGLTTREPQERWKEHLRNSKKVDLRLYRAMRKYGQENFEMEVVAFIRDLKNVDLLFEIERNYIQEHNSYWFGYNDTIGGRGVKQLKRGRKKQLKAF